MSERIASRGMHAGSTIYLNTKDLKPIQPSGFAPLNTKDQIPIQPSGFVPPSQRVHYSHELVQSFLYKAFGGLFPKLEMLENGTAAYRHRNPDTDSFIGCVAAESINNIPQEEAMKLLQGWIMLRKLVMEATVPDGVRSLLMNLKIPDPRVSPWFYRLRVTPDGQNKLYILIGFEGPAVTLVSLEECIAAIMNVPPSQLESLLATTMAPTGITNRVYVLDSDGKTTGNTIYLNTMDLIPIQPSEFVSPSQRVHYSHDLVQSFLFEAFGGIFPKLEMLEDGTVVYRHRNPETDSFLSCVAAESIDDIPQGEAMKLLQGWIMLRKLVMEETVPEGARSLLMNLKIPDPRVSSCFYRLRKTLDGQNKLYILIGFEGPAVTLVSIEECIAAIMNLPPSQLESLLATSMAPTGITNRVNVLDSNAKTDSDSKNTSQVSDDKPAGRKNTMMLALAAVVLLLGSISTVILGMVKNGDDSLAQSEQIATTPMDEIVMNTKEAVPELSEKFNLDVADNAKEAVPEPTEMAGKATNNMPEPADDLSLEMTIGAKSNMESDDTEKNSDDVDLIEQMK